MFACLSHFPNGFRRLFRLSRLAATAACLICVPAGCFASALSTRDIQRMDETLDGYPMDMHQPVRVMEESFSPEKIREADALRDYFYLSHLFHLGEHDRILEFLKDRPQGEPLRYRTRLLEIRALHRKGDRPAAIARCRDLVRDEPLQTDGHLLLADLYAQAGDADSLIETLESARKIFPLHREILQRLHRQYVQKFGQAQSDIGKMRYLNHLEEISEKIVEAMPGHLSAPYLRTLALIKMEKGETEKAIEFARRLILLEPREIGHYIQLSRFLEQTGDLDGALNTLRRASVVNPEAPAIARHLNALLLKMRRPEGLLDFYASLATEYPGRGDIQMLYAKQLAMRFRQQEAVRILRDSLHLQPNNPESWLFLAELEFALGRRDLGAQALGSYLEHIPRSGDNLAQVAKTLLLFECFEEAAARIEELKALEPGHSAIPTLELQTAIRMQDQEKVVQLLEAAIAARPEEISSYVLLYTVFEEMGQMESAIPLLQKSLEHVSGEDSRMIRELLVSAYQENKQYEEAVRTATEMLESDPDDWRMRIWRLRLYWKMDREEKIEPELSQVIAAHQDDPDVQYAVAMLKWDLKQFEGTAACLRRAIALNPDFAEALNALGYFFAERGGDLDEALNLVLKALHLEPEAGHMIDSLGWIYYKKGEYETAVVMLEQAARKTGNDPVVLDHLGDAYVKLQRFSDALKKYERALQKADAELAENLRGKIESLKKNQE